LNNTALIPTIKEDVIAAQRMDIGMGHPPKIRVGRSPMLPTRCRWSSMVQEPPCGSKGL
jgi:hypothetical protein